MALAPKIRGLGFDEREDRVDVIAAGMMAKDNPLMQRARASGMSTANRRGLMNSSIAAGASTGAALDQVVPMAGQTAGQQFQKNRAGQDYGINSELQREGYRQNKDLTRDKGRIDRYATSEEYRLRGGLSAQEAQQQQALARQGYNINSELQKQGAQQARYATSEEYSLRGGLSAQEARQQRTAVAQEYGLRGTLQDSQNKYEGTQAALDRTYEADQAARNRQFEQDQGTWQRASQERIANLGLKGDAARVAQSSVDNAFNGYQSTINNIMANPNLSSADRTAAIEAAKGLLQRQTTYVSQLHTTALTWPKGGFGTSTPPAGGAVAPGAQLGPGKTSAPAEPAASPSKALPASANRWVGYNDQAKALGQR